LETVLGRTLPPGRPIGESWEIVDRPEAQSVVDGGEFDGLSLREVIQRHAAEVMGPRWPADKPFPILVKWLDCRERLSLQVHPPADVAPSLGGEPKTENWFVAAAEPGAHLIVGLRPGVTRAQFEKAIGDGTLEECVNRVPVSPGDSVLVRSGQVHAIDGGNLILEIQQNSDTTYRVYDWGRVGLDGKPRQLHVAESLQSIRWDARPPTLVKSARKMAALAYVREFQICRCPFAAGKTLDINAEEGPVILSVVEGRLASDHGDLKRGDNVLVSYSAAFVLTVVEDAVVLMTFGFCGKDPHQLSHLKEAEDCSPEELAVAWMEQARQEDGENWAIQRVIQLCSQFSDPELVWPIILRLVELAPDDELLEYVGAQVLEEVLDHDAETWIGRLEAQAGLDRKFQCCLSAVWSHSLPEPVQARLKRAAGDMKRKFFPVPGSV
jgi:mannose-6-phosphate isomerase